MKLAGLILSTSIIALGAPAVAAPPVVMAKTTATPAAQQSAHDRLFQLFKDSDEASLKRNPLQALFRGDYRYAAHLGDYVTDAYYAAERAAAESELARLLKPAERGDPRGLDSPLRGGEVA